MGVTSATEPAGTATTAAAASTAAATSTELAGLPLPALRAYRQMLVDEESRVSYWRRILQARLDVLRAEQPAGVAPRHASREAGVAGGRRLESVLAHAHVASRRAALLAVLPATVVPPLPQLEALWDVPAEGQRPGAQPHGTLPRATLLAQLADAEQALSAYRAALHLRLDQATDELVRRYAEDPRRCLGALPLPPHGAS